MAKSDVSAVTKYFPTVNEGFTTTLGSTILSGAATVPLNSASGLTNGTTFVGMIEPGLTKQQVFTGTVDTAGVQITGVKWTRGTNADHSAGVTIVDYVTGTALNMISAGIKVSHNDDGTLKQSVKVPYVTSTTSTTTPTPDLSASSMYIITALAGNATFGAPTGSPVQGQQLIIRIKDNGTARTLAWNAVYRAVGVALPTTTILSKTLYLGFIYNSTDAKWDLIALAQEA